MAVRFEAISHAKDRSVPCLFAAYYMLTIVWFRKILVSVYSGFRSAPPAFFAVRSINGARRKHHESRTGSSSHSLRIWRLDSSVFVRGASRGEHQHSYDSHGNRH